VYARGPLCPFEGSTANTLAADRCCVNEMTPSDPPADSPKRGADLLLEHVMTLDEATRPHARERLEALLGRELSTLLEFALTNRAKQRDG
jgi:uncharacterized tellurite resistance protein B-like protein